VLLVNKWSSGKNPFRRDVYGKFTFYIADTIDGIITDKLLTITFEPAPIHKNVMVLSRIFFIKSNMRGENRI
jgi:hypothetical protein